MSVPGSDLPPGFDAVERMRYLFAGRASKVTPNGRLQSCVIVVLVDAVLVCSHRGGVHRYLPIEAIRSLTTFPRGWLLLNCSGPFPGHVVTEPSRTHDLMLVLSVPQRLVEVLQRVRAARTGSMLHLSTSDQFPSLADFRLRPLESAPTHAPLRMWALATAANTQRALDTLSSTMENYHSPGLHLVRQQPATRYAGGGGDKGVAGDLQIVRARGPPFTYAPSEWLAGVDVGVLTHHHMSQLIMAVTRFVPTREQQLAASGDGGPTNGTATVIFPLHFSIAAVLAFAYARFPHTAIAKGHHTVPSVTLRFLAPQSTVNELRALATPPPREPVESAQQQQQQHGGGNTRSAGSGGMEPLRIAESYFFSVMRQYSAKVLQIVSVQRQIVTATGGVNSLPPVNTEGAAFWRNPRVALFGEVAALHAAAPH